MSDLKTISIEQLVEVNGGQQTYRELTRFANSHGYVVTSSTGGHHLGWAHAAVVRSTCGRADTAPLTSARSCATRARTASP